MANPKNYVLKVKAGVSRLNLPGLSTAVDAAAVVEMTPAAFAQMNADQLAGIDITQTPAGPLSAAEKDAFATDAEVAAAVAAGGNSPVKSNDTNTAIIPVDNSDSWIVGSDRMGQDGADTTKDTRAFFNKGLGAFRSGRDTIGRWATQGRWSAAFGNDCSATSDMAFATGNATSATGIASHATGYLSQATALYSHAEGESTIASGNSSHAEGKSTTASGAQSHAEGFTTTASGDSSHAEGVFAVSSRHAQYAKSSSRFVVNGDAQFCNMVLHRQTADAVPAVMASGGSAGQINLTGNSVTVLTVPASRAFTLKISTVARRTDVQGEMAGFTWEGLVGRDSTGNARIIGTPTTAGWADAAAAGWTVAVSIDTSNATNNFVAVTVTGEAAKTIRWVAKMEWVEVGG